MTNLARIISDLSALTIVEASDLVKQLEAKWDVKSIEPIQKITQPLPPAVKTEFSVQLLGFGQKKIGVIKEVRAFTGLGLKEAKDLVESVPVAIAEGLPQMEAQELMERLQAAGGVVALR